MARYIATQSSNFISISELNWNGLISLAPAPSIQWINFTTFTLNAVNEWFIDYISLTSLHFGKSTHSIRIHTAQAKRSELLGLYWVIAFIVVSLYRFTLVRFLQFVHYTHFIEFILHSFFRSFPSIPLLSLTVHPSLTFNQSSYRSLHSLHSLG